MMISPAAPGRPGSSPWSLAYLWARSMSPEAFSAARDTGTGVLVGPGVPDAVAVGDALAVGDTLGEEVALGLAPGPAEAEPLEVGEGDGEGLGDGDGLGVGDGVGVGVATGEGLGDGVWPTGVGVEARFSPTSSWPTPVASKWTVVPLFFIASTELVRRSEEHTH